MEDVKIVNATVSGIFSYVTYCFYQIGDAKSVGRGFFRGKHVLKVGEVVKALVGKFNAVFGRRELVLLEEQKASPPELKTVRATLMSFNKQLGQWYAVFLSQQGVVCHGYVDAPPYYKRGQVVEAVWVEDKFVEIDGCKMPIPSGPKHRWQLKMLKHEY